MDLTDYYEQSIQIKQFKNYIFILPLAVVKILGYHQILTLIIHMIYLSPPLALTTADVSCFL